MFFLVYALLFSLSLVLYIFTAPPAYIPVDSAEFALCMHFWGICHPPGFPLYILIGKAFIAILPAGTLIFKAHLLSSIYGALTIANIYLILRKIGSSSLSAILVSSTLAISSPFWEFAVSADVFTFATFLITLTFLFIFYGKVRLSFFALGLSASHFYTTAILFPVIYWYLCGIQVKPKNIAQYFLAFTLGFFPQGVLFFRMLANPEVNWGHVQNLADFWSYLRREEFGSLFLISNPELRFSLIKLVRHILVFMYHLFINFSVLIVPITAFVILKKRVTLGKNAAFPLTSCSLILFFSFITLSTIDPLLHQSFQIRKFYLLPFTMLILCLGVLWDRCFGKSKTASLSLLLLLATLIALNFPSHNLSSNNFTRDYVLDALEQLPDGSTAIILNHQFYFGSLYEQKISGQFQNTELLYFPNEANRDAEKYVPSILQNPPDQDFIAKVSRNVGLGKSESYILGLIARNLDRPIFILQGDFEDVFFSYLRPYLKSYGLWWQLSKNPLNRPDTDKSISLLGKLRNQNIKKMDLKQPQQQSDSLTYAIAFHSLAVALARQGKYNEALSFFQKSLYIDETKTNILQEIKLVSETRGLEAQFSQYVESKNSVLLRSLGDKLYTIGNFEKDVEVFTKLLEIDPSSSKDWSNLASSHASLGHEELAKKYFLKALELDPSLELAKQGLATLGQ